MNFNQVPHYLPIKLLFYQLGEMTAVVDNEKISQIGDNRISDYNELEEPVETWPGTKPQQLVNQDTTGEKVTLKQDKQTQLDSNQYDDKLLAPKYQMEEIEKLLELADDDTKQTESDEEVPPATINFKDSFEVEELQRNKLSSSVNENPRVEKKILTSYENVHPKEKEEKPVPAPRRLFLQDRGGQRSDRGQDNRTNVRERAQTFSHVASYYHQGTSIGKIYITLSSFQAIC